jgi:hypothetical protein
MTAIWFNFELEDVERRRRLFEGEIFVYDRLPSVLNFVSFSRGMLEAALSPHDPRFVHESLTPVELAPLLGRLKPEFTHHREAQRLAICILAELGVDVDDCHVDVPKLRTAFPVGHLTKGIAYAFPAHRDSWYGAPQAQINWWLPIYPLNADNTMAFYPRCFSTAVANDSHLFNYYRRNVERKDVAEFVDEDPRVQPSALALQPDEPEFRLLPAVGGLIVFSAVQLHATFTTPASLSRYSIDFRTVSRRDVECGRGAPNFDSSCIGTALRDFRRAADSAAIPEELARKLDPGGPAAGEIALFDPDVHAEPRDNRTSRRPKSPRATSRPTAGRAARPPRYS